MPRVLFGQGAKRPHYSILPLNLWSLFDSYTSSNHILLDGCHGNLHGVPSPACPPTCRSGEDSPLGQDSDSEFIDRSCGPLCNICMLRQLEMPERSNSELIRKLFTNSIRKQSQARPKDLKRMTCDPTAHFLLGTFRVKRSHSSMSVRARG